MKLAYTSHGSDLYAQEVACTCLDPRWKDTEVAHLFKRKIKLTGYDDRYFFENVHAEPHEGACQCGRKFTFQWKREAVNFEWNKGE